MYGRIGFVLLAVASAAAAPPAPVPVPDEAARGVTLAVVARRLDQPLALAFAAGDPGKRLFVVEKTGRIRIVKGGQLLAEPFIDLSDRVSGGSEQGLLGLAFHPRYAENGRFFVNYTNTRGDTRVVEIETALPGADRATIVRERVLLEVDQPYSNHNGGHLVMGPDGKLLVGLGDGGSANDPRGYAQSNRSLLGKMLRIDPNAQGKAAAAKILAKGLRNPWRYALDRKTSDLYIGDVGQNAWEEIDVVALDALEGLNFGWNVMEGLHCFGKAGCNTAGLTLPVVEYGHDAGCSITGGVVYRGKAIPSLDGAYFYSDYCTAFLRSFRWNRTSKTITDHWDWSKALNPASRLAQIASFGEDEDGEVYVLSLAGTVWKLVPR